MGLLKLKMKNIAIISFGTGGTMGHMSLTTNISKLLVQNRHKVYLFSEQDYSSFSNSGSKFIKFVSIQKQKHLKTVGGCLNYKHKSELIKLLVENNIEVVIFSTFFDLEIVEFCNKNKIKSILISYPLRDSHRKAIELRRYYDSFTRIFTLKDISDTKKVSNKEFIVSPIKTNSTLKKKSKLKLNRILISCGGGGRPSSKLFFKNIKKIVQLIYQTDKSIIFTIITGNSNQRLKLPNSKVINWSNKFFKLLNQHDLLISEAGYFTILDLINAKVPAILMPGERRIDNQELRALKYQESGCGYTYFPNENPKEIVERIISLKEEEINFSNLLKGYSRLNDNIFNKYPKLEEELIKFLEL